MIVELILLTLCIITAFTILLFPGGIKGRVEAAERDIGDANKRINCLIVRTGRSSDAFRAGKDAIREVRSEVEEVGSRLNVFSDQFVDKLERLTAQLGRLQGLVEALYRRE